MEDCWLENEEFNFDLPLSPLSGEKCDKTDTADKDGDDDYDDEVFFGPVGHLERCAAVVAKKENIEPLKPLQPAEQVSILQESVKLSCLLKHKPLNTIQNIRPGPLIYPLKRNSSDIDITKLKLCRDKLSSKEDKENIENDGKEVGLTASRNEMESSQEQREDGSSDKKDGIKEPRHSPSPSCKVMPSHRRSFTGTEEKKIQVNNTSMAMGSSIPKIQSKIARPSSIPSLKPGLLRGQTRLKSAAPQESKLKPLKALKPTHALINEPSKAGVPSKGKIPSNSLNKFVTPKKNSEVKHTRSNTQDNQTRRRSTDLSTSMSKLSFSRPNHNSTPKQQECPLKQSSNLRRSLGSAGNSMKTSSSSTNTPLKTKLGKPLGSVKREIGQDTPSKKPTSSRRSLVPKPNSNQGDTPLRAKSGQRRGSLLKYPSTNPSLDKKKTTDGNTSVVRSGTFVLNGPSPKSKRDVSLIDVDTSETDSNIAAHVHTTCSSAKDSIAALNFPDVGQQVFPDTMKDSCSPLVHQADILMPEIPALHTSPLLKFDSPLPDGITSDPFTTGSTPPCLSVGEGVLAPVQMEANLIQL